MDKDYKGRRKSALGGKAKLPRIPRFPRFPRNRPGPARETSILAGKSI